MRKLFVVSFQAFPLIVGEKQGFVPDYNRPQSSGVPFQVFLKTGKTKADVAFGCLLYIHGWKGRSDFDNVQPV